MDIGAIIKEQYQVVEHIGRGGMADVWSAQDMRLRRMVAVKTIASSMAVDGDPLALFEREARTIAQMEHPHILPIYDFGDYDNSLYIVMRYVTGGSLEDQLALERLPVNETLEIADAIARALDHAHDQNVIHLDLKPGNILLDAAGSPYLADFGLATVLDPEGRARNPGSGTLLYMAPEQLTADTIDHRADIYSFCIMLYHMLTGQLPFNGMAPMALRQIQNGERLPYLSDASVELPDTVDDILRLGTASDPEMRPDDHGEIVQQLREVLLPGAPTALYSSGDSSAAFSFVDASDFAPGASPEVREAVEIFNRARHAWQSGQGRFLLGVTHFRLIADTYRDAAKHGLTVDEAGYQVLLRGALEYDYQLNHWWRVIGTDDARRWVCLHTIRSGTSPARVRALYRLETLPDDPQNPVIPRLVAQALDTETDAEAKIAALNVLRTRAKLLKSRSNVKLKTAYQGRLLNTMTRIGIQMQEPSFWQETVYGTDVDLMIAEASFDDDAQVGEAAARAVGQIRSLAAVRYLSQAQQNGQEGALDALALVRDEVPALPADVSRQARSYAWLTNTINRLQAHALEGVLRIGLVFLAGWIAMGEQVYNIFRSQQLFNAQRWGNAIAVGAVFGVFVALTYTVGYEANRRLRGFWTWWQRLLVFGLLGMALASLSYGGFTWMYFNQPPAWDLMQLGGAGLVFGMVAAALLKLHPLAAVLLTTIMTFLPIYGSFTNLINHDNFTIVPGLLIMLLVGVFCGATAARTTETPLQVRGLENPFVQGSLGVGIALIWTLVTWVYIGQVQTSLLTGGAVTWDSVLLIMSIMVAIGGVVGYGLPRGGRWLFAATATLGFGVAYAAQAWRFFDLSASLPVLPESIRLTLTYYDGQPLAPMPFDSLFLFDDPNHIFTIALPMVLVVALGTQAGPLLRGWWEWIGGPHNEATKRDEWLSVLLPYVMGATALMSVLALFSLKVNVALSLFWSAWAFVTFVGALAAWRWAKWGADVLLASGMVMVVGAFAYDALTIYDATRLGRVPGLLQDFPIGPSDAPLVTLNALLLWGVWSAILGIFAWGALRRALWGGIGAVVLLLLWYLVAIFTPLQGSVLVLALAHLVVVAFALGSAYASFEPDRFRLRRTVDSPVPVETEHTAPPTMPISRRITERQTNIGAAPTEMDPAVIFDDDAPTVALKEFQPSTPPDAPTEALDVPFDRGDASEAPETEEEAQPVRFDGQTLTENAPQVSIGTGRMRTEATPQPDTEVLPEAPKKDSLIQLDVGRLRAKPTTRLPELEDDEDETDS